MAPELTADGLEEAIARIWADTLGRDEVTGEDSFFELGGDSLAAGRVAARMRAELGVDMPLRALFLAPTVKGVAAALAAPSDDAPAVELAADPGSGTVASPAQERLFLLDQLDPGNPAYNDHFALRLAGELDPAALAAALQSIVDRHEVLHSSFAAADGTIAVRVVADVRVELGRHDLRGVAPAEREAVALEQAQAVAAAPFDLTQAPLLHAELLRLGDREHVLVVAVHHIVFDGWSLGVLLTELETFYAAAVAGAEPDVAPLPLQYRDYARRRRAELDGPDVRDDLRFWSEQLAGAPALDLPVDHPRPPVPSAGGGHERFRFGPEAVAAIERCARAGGATPFMVVAAGWLALLGRYAGQDDVTIGTAVAGRARPELESLIGCFINMIAVRGDLSGDPTFAELVSRTRDATLAALAHQDAPFEQVVAELAPARDPSRSPLFQAGLMFQNAALPELALPGLRVSTYDLSTPTAKFDVTLSIWTGDDPGVLEADLEYRDDLFEPSTMAGLARSLVHLLAAATADGEMRLSALPLLDARERDEILARGDGERAPGPDVPVHAQVRDHAHEHPDAIAVRGPSGELTYAALVESADAIAGVLRGLGVAPGDLVAVCLPRSPELIAAQLGALFSGAVFVPLDPGYPPAWLAQVVADAGVRAVVTETGLAGPFADGDAAILALDAPPAASVAGPPPAAPLDAPAYVLHTSGSTGRPKGVVMSQRGFANLAHWYPRRFGIGTGTVVGHLAGLGFDAAILEVWPALAHGATVALAPEPARRDLEELVGWLAEASVDVSFIPTPMAEALLQQPELAASVRARTLLAGGDRLSARPAPGLPFTLHNGYGPTEAAVMVSGADVAPHGAGLPSIGRPVPNASLVVLDDRLEPVPAGVVGELHIGGPGLALGYLGNPGMTAERFVPDLRHPGQRLYRTGDLVRWRADGDLEFVGRCDEQVKVRGVRIELGEVEAVVLAHAAVQSAVALVLDDGGPRRLVAAVTPQDVDTDALRRALAERLPSALVPHEIVALGRLPMTAVGKIDRQALAAELRRDGHRAEPEAEPPATAVQAQLAAVWSEVLGIDAPRLDDDFFALGGDSIASMRLVARARARGLELRPAQVFQHPTLRALSAVAALAKPVAPPARVRGPVPLTPIQRWFLDRHGDRPQHFTQAAALAVRELDVGALEAALLALVRHHDALRLRFLQSSSGWRAVALGADDVHTVPVEVVDGTGLDDDARRARLAEAGERVKAGLHLSHGPMVAAVAVTGGPDADDLVAVVAHHLTVDWISWGVLVDDLQLAYDDAWQGRPATLADPGASYRDWAEALERAAASPALERERQDWARLLAGGATELPLDHSGGAATEATTATVPFTLDRSLTSALLEDVPAQSRARPLEVLLAALVPPLAAWTEAGALLVELEGHGRDALDGELDVARTVGWFTALYPIALDLTMAAEPLAALRDVRGRLADVPRGGAGWGLLIEGSAPIRVNYLGRLDAAVSDGPGMRIVRCSTGRDRDPDFLRDHVLDIEAAVVDGQLTVEWGFSRALHDEATIRALAAAHRDALTTLIEKARTSDTQLHVAADFPLADLDSDDLDRILRQG